MILRVHRECYYCHGGRKKEKHGPLKLRWQHLHKKTCSSRPVTVHVHRETEMFCLFSCWILHTASSSPLQHIFVCNILTLIIHLGLFFWGHWLYCDTVAFTAKCSTLFLVAELSFVPSILVQNRSFLKKSLQKTENRQILDKSRIEAQSTTRVAAVLVCSNLILRPLNFMWIGRFSKYFNFP